MPHGACGIGLIYDLQRLAQVAILPMDFIGPPARCNGAQLTIHRQRGMCCRAYRRTEAKATHDYAHTCTPCLQYYSTYTIISYHAL